MVDALKHGAYSAALCLTAMLCVQTPYLAMGGDDGRLSKLTCKIPVSSGGSKASKHDVTELPRSYMRTPSRSLVSR